MQFKKFQWWLLVRVILLFATLTVAAYIFVNQQYAYLILLLPIIGYQVFEFLRFNQKAHIELDQFVESVQYRDFSRYFDVKHAPLELQPLRKGFNDINSTIKVISKERETQYQYLQKILELVDTGILSYEEESGNVMWMNETLKRMLQLPYLRTIQSLDKRDASLAAAVNALRPGISSIATAQVEKSTFKLLLSATSFQTDGKKFKLIAFQNVEEALDETEAKAWQKLLSVMTHEIMNSVAPISSLADTLKHRLQASLPYLNNETGSVDDLELGIETIKRRSEGLLKFAQTYRNLNKINTLNLAPVYVRDVFENLLQLMQPTLEKKNIEAETILKDTDLQLQADISLLEQVLINLLLNAIEAVKEKEEPRIVLSAYKNTKGKIVIRVADNGSGIAQDLLDKIFIPFFSTKKSGSGIGLSLCKQIMLLHKGNIYVQSVEGEGTAFLLQF